MYSPHNQPLYLKFYCIFILVLFSCNKEEDPPEMPTSNFQDHPIKIGNINNQAVFIDERSDEIFSPRGTNYFNIVTTNVGYQDRFFHPNHFNISEITSNIRNLKNNGYNTIRIFLDTCNDDPDCIGNTNGQGLNQNYIHNIVSLLDIAAEQNIFLILTSNDLPNQGGYWEMSNQGTSNLIEGYRNAHYITSEGVEAAKLYWGDLMQSMVDMDADFSHVLAWSILNEQWFFNNAPPFNLQSGNITAANGKSYSLSSEQEKIKLAEECTDYYISEVASVIRNYDEEGLVTMGVFAPYSPHEWRPNDFKLSVQSVTENPDLDFLDLHLYPGTETMENLMENFQIRNPESKPMIIGEVGAFIDLYGNISQAESALQNWIARSCSYGFDGWLTWGLERAPVDIGDATWSLYDNNQQLLEELSPNKYPDPCNEEWLPDENLALEKPVTTSRELGPEPAENAVDGNINTQWGSGNHPPQWIEIDLEAAQSISRISLVVAQFPEGPTTHDIIVKDSEGNATPLMTFNQNTKEGDRLEWSGNLPDVRYVRIETSVSPSWVSWKEIEVY